MQTNQHQLEQSLNAAMHCIQLNDFARAEHLLEPVRQSEDSRVHYFLGAIAQSRGNQHTAVSEFARAAELNNFNLELTADSIFKLIANDAIDVAERLNQKAIEKTPGYFGHHYCAALIHLNKNELELAVEKFRDTEKIKPDLLECHVLAGKALHLLGRLSESEDALLKALALAPNDAALHVNLASLLLDCVANEGAYEHAKRAVTLNKNLALAWALLASAARELRLLDEALSAAEHACRLEPENPECRRSRGTVLKELGRPREAACDFDFATSKRFEANTGKQSNLKEHRYLSRAKVEHDIEQFDYLERIHKDAKYSNLASEYRELLKELPNAPGTEIMPIPNEIFGSMREHFNRILNVQATNFSGPALSESLDTESVENDYFARSPGITWIDNLLSEKALEALRRYCLESTLWFDFNHPNGYLGAVFENGFTDPLLLQICDELKRKFPKIFAQYPLMQMWAFKYDSRLNGIQLHGDEAAVNLNFWITPDDANLDQSSGGLRVWDKAAPANWRFKDFNSGAEQVQSRIQKFLSDNQANEIVVPYRQNRAVVFNSDLFHATDEFHFKEGYENRRINITMLFGLRNQQ